MMRLVRRRTHSEPPRGDAELLARVAEGHLDALGELYDRYARDVWRVARRTLDPRADVEDLVHMTFIELPKVAGAYDGRASCRAWLCGIAVRLALRQRRGAWRFRRMVQAFEQTIAGRTSSGDPERSASSNEQLAVFERLLGDLSDKKRAVFVLIELEGLTTEQTAEALQIPVATVRTRLFHARRELSAGMQPWTVT